MTPEAVVAEAWDQFWLAEGHEHIHVRCCILASRVAIALLDEMGVRAEAWPTNTVVFNDAAAQLVAADVPVDQWPPHAWSVGTDLDSRYREDGSLDGWPGHLWIRTDKYAIDMSHRQFDRPGLIRADGPLLVFHGGKTDMLTVTGNGRVVIAKSTGDRSYRHAPDWRRRWREWVDQVRSYQVGADRSA